ncbi:MAG TPA: hypothetical protein VFA33_16045 [Bryobacteraceae bacterium]|nr:hypothetical protein [Bryobacteraceae bacterium]
MTRILLLGFDKLLCDELVRVLSEMHHAPLAQAFSDGWIDHAAADVVFCSGDDPRFRDALREVKHKKPGLPFVVVTRLPEVSAWLDALEAGASDYCAAPFEPVQMRWIMDSTVPRKQRAAA